MCRGFQTPVFEEPDGQFPRFIEKHILPEHVSLKWNYNQLSRTNSLVCRERCICKRLKNKSNNNNNNNNKKPNSSLAISAGANISLLSRRILILFGVPAVHRIWRLHTKFRRKISICSGAINDPNFPRPTDRPRHVQSLTWHPIVSRIINVSCRTSAPFLKRTQQQWTYYLQLQSQKLKHIIIEVK